MYEKMAYANSIDPDQTAPLGAVWSGSTLFCHFTKYFKKQLHKKQYLRQKSMEWRVRSFSCQKPFGFILSNFCS